MINLPDISDLVEAKKWLNVDFPDHVQEVIKLNDCIIQRYRDAKITPKDCDHPLTKLNGLANYCEYCGFTDTYLEFKR